MQPCEELKRAVLRHYRMIGNGEQAETIHELYSHQEGVVIIGNDPQEWFDTPEGIEAFTIAGGTGKKDIEIHDVCAYSEGSVGWTVDRVTVGLPNGNQIPVRHTRIFHREGDSWKLVHLHVSIAVPNESIDG